jgi:hypothetical protein
MNTSIHNVKFNIDNSIAYVSLTPYLLYLTQPGNGETHILYKDKNQIFKSADQYNPDLKHNLE